jgi:HSP20 family protein
MALRSLLHGDGKKTLTPATREESPLATLEHRMNDMMEGFFHDFGLEPWSLNRTSTFTPRVNVSEDEKSVYVTAELPGLDEKDIDVTLTRDALVIKGTKQSESEQSQADYYRMERSYGEFRRVVPLPAEIDSDKAEATFRKGVLSITLPKVEAEVKQQKKIEIKGGE